MKRKDLRASTLVVLNRENLILDPLAALHLDNCYKVTHETKMDTDYSFYLYKNTANGCVFYICLAKIVFNQIICLVMENHCSRFIITPTRLVRLPAIH